MGGSICDTWSLDGSQESIYKLSAIEGSEVVQALPGPDEQNGNAQFLLDCQRYASPCRAIQLGQEDARAVNGILEGLGLGKPVVARGGIQRQYDLVRGRWV